MLVVASRQGEPVGVHLQFLDYLQQVLFRLGPQIVVALQVVRLGGFPLTPQRRHVGVEGGAAAGGGGVVAGLLGSVPGHLMLSVVHASFCGVETFE